MPTTKLSIETLKDVRFIFECFTFIVQWKGGGHYGYHCYQRNTIISIMSVV